MTEVALITTTINVPTVLTQWAKSGMTEDDIIIVAGDLKSPHVEIAKLLIDIHKTTGVNTVYLTPEVQEQYEISEVIGWNCIQRRNIALLRAMKENPEYILTIDDDNAPTSMRQVSQLVNVMNDAHDDLTNVVSTSTGWYNPGRQCLTDDMKWVVHRGFPMSRRHEKPFYVYEHMRPPVGVAAMLWTGEPDIDAMERIINHPNVTRVTSSSILEPGTWAPFNTQATIFRAELAPAMFMWPHVGRYDDIWASYLTRAVMDQLGWGVYYGRPAVHQDRNEHDLLKDLEAEIFGMKHNETIINALRDEKLDGLDQTQIIEMTIALLNAVEKTSILPHNTSRSFRHWINDVRRAQEVTS